MYLVRLELQGFKSFAHRTAFEFTPGVTAVVGPNGSGKSNVADAVRWVLGEHSFRQLRARQGEDLIFVGSQTRSRVGMAEAILVFDNSSGWLPIAFSEVSVGRRAYRSGENEYLINNSRVRRRDVIELLAQGGVSASAYTIIAQGLVDEILSLRPEDRRQVVEEAAGIRIYQDQRQAALLKLQATRENLTRLRDILSEISPRLESLRRQAQRAEQYRAAAQELEGLLLTWYGHQWHLNRRALRAAEERAARLESELGDALQRGAQLTASLESQRANAQGLRERLEEWRARRTSLWNSLQEVAREVAVKEERWGLLRRSEAETSEGIDSLQVRQASTERELEQARRRVDNLETERRALTEGAGTDRAHLEQELLQAQDRAFQRATTVADLRVQLAQVRDRGEAILREMAEEEASSAALRSHIAPLEEALSALERERREQESQLQLIEQESVKKGAGLTASSKRTAELAARREENERAVARLEARRASLYPRAGPPHLEIPGLRGPLAELLQVPTPFQPAIRAALGQSAQAWVVDRWADVQGHLGELPGQVRAILPLDLVRPFPRPPFPKDAGVLGLASDLVSCEADLRPLCESLLGRTLIVNDLPTALRLYRSNSAELDLVTSAGQILTARGALILGPAGEDPSEAQPEGRSLAEETSQLEAQRQDLLQAWEAQSRLQAEAEASAEALREERRRLEERVRDVERAWEAKRRESERQAQELSWHEAIAQRLQAEHSSLQRSQGDLEQRLSHATGEESTALSHLERLRQRALYSGEPNLTAALLEERLGNARSNLSALEAHFEELQQEIAQRLARQQAVAREAEALEADLAVVRATGDRLRAQVEELDARSEPARAELDSLTRTVALHEQELIELREAVHQEEMERAQVLAETERQKDKLSSLQSQIETDLENVSVSLPGATQLPLEGQVRLESLPEVHEIPAGIDRKVRSLRHTLRRIGGVDPEALAEYEELEARHRFLSSQVEDLERAMAQLQELIARLDRLMRERFWDAFQAVATEFENYFTTLFKGGSAKLLLTDPQDLTTTGVEIIAQPPGKRRQNVALLSGGERALTGVALVFALLKTGTSPFCVLDEVDAMLDEVNIRRFHEALLQLAQQVQVIIITHNRITIEAADTVYGITLGDDSISRVLSLRLDRDPKGAASPVVERERRPARAGHS